jgi:hypothetical protein
MLRVKDEKELHRYGLAIDPRNPSQAVAIGEVNDHVQSEMDVAIQQPQSPSSESAGSFARETSCGPLGDVSAWDNRAVAAGMKVECAEIRAIDRCYPGRYHRLGVLIIESTKRFGGDAVRQMLRSERISKTMAHWAVRIAELYTYEQAVRFESARAIIKTLPARQPRKTTPKATLDGHIDGQVGAPKKPPEVAQPPATEENIIGEFIRLGERIRELYGDEALDAAVEQIKSQAAQTFEDIFEEVQL